MCMSMYLWTCACALLLFPCVCTDQYACTNMCCVRNSVHTHERVGMCILCVNVSGDVCEYVRAYISANVNVRVCVLHVYTCMDV